MCACSHRCSEPPLCRASTLLLAGTNFILVLPANPTLVLLFHPGAWGFVFPVESSGVGGELSLLPAAASAPDLCFAAVRRPVMLPHRMLRHHFAIGNQRGGHQALFYLLKHSRSEDRLHQELHVGSPLPLLTFISQSSPSNRQSLCKRRRLDSGFNSTCAVRR
uniref:Uncharacterized protein n=1 Tax=Aegilops tauschii subsp. strangulata TaxID=200361 RepID=A0A453KLY6_AEGTS